MRFGVDIFSGAGGLSLGAEMAGIRISHAVEINQSAVKTFVRNHKDAQVLQIDVKDIKDSDFESKKNPIFVIMGGPPCQGFSMSNTRTRNMKNEKNFLFLEFVRLVKEIRPTWFVLENVCGLTNINDGKTQAMIEDCFKELGYTVKSKVLWASDYGVPQNRKRLLLLASKLGNIKLIDSIYNKNSYITVRDVISHLPKISAGETHEADFLHSSRKLSELNLKRIKSSKPGGTWKDWDENLLPDCYKRKSGESYSAVYGRLEWDKPSSTITTQFPGYGNGRFGHPEQDRALSLREGAIIQTFPDNYKFIKDKKDLNFSKIATQIGNAVPPKLGEIIGLSIKKHLEEVYHECY